MEKSKVIACFRAMNKKINMLIYDCKIGVKIGKDTCETLRISIDSCEMDIASDQHVLSWLWYIVSKINSAVDTEKIVVDYTTKMVIKALREDLREITADLGYVMLGCQGEIVQKVKDHDRWNT
jgi:hypothetical protein